MKLAITLLLGLLASTALCQTTVRITGYGGQDPAIVNRLINEVIGEDLQAEGITVQYEPVEGDYNAGLFNALSAGTAGDIFYIPAETAPGILATGTVLPLNDVVDTEPFIDTLLEPFTLDGQVYGIPKDFNTLAVFYNEDLFDEAGVDYPNAEDTWETFAEKLRGVSELGDDVEGACVVADLARMGPFAFADGWQTFSEDGSTSLQDEAFVDAFDYYTGLVQGGAAVLSTDLGQDWAGGCFGTGNTGVAIEGAWILGYLRDTAPNLQYGTTFLPVAPSGETGNYTYTVAYGVNANSSNQEAALHRARGADQRGGAAVGLGERPRHPQPRKLRRQSLLPRGHARSPGEPHHLRGRDARQRPELSIRRGRHRLRDAHQHRDQRRRYGSSRRHARLRAGAERG